LNNPKDKKLKIRCLLILLIFSSICSCSSLKRTTYDCPLLNKQRKQHRKITQTFTFKKKNHNRINVYEYRPNKNDLKVFLSNQIDHLSIQPISDKQIKLKTDRLNVQISPKKQLPLITYEAKPMKGKVTKNGKWEKVLTKKNRKKKKINDANESKEYFTEKEIYKYEKRAIWAALIALTSIGLWILFALLQTFWPIPIILMLGFLGQLISNKAKRKLKKDFKLKGIVLNGISKALLIISYGLSFIVSLLFLQQLIES